MKIAYFDCFSGISGDMCLGALVDAGVPLEELGRRLKKLPLKGYTLSAKKAKRAGIAATKVDVRIDKNATEQRKWKDIEKIIRVSSLPPAIAQQGLTIFRSLFEAEARVHGEPVRSIHLHELGAVDCFIDIFGTLLGLDMLGIEAVYSSPINLGGGRVKTCHGTLPVPAPATAELLSGVPVYADNGTFEMTTPTGAALIKTLARGFGGLPPFVPDIIGTGAGGKDPESMPNVLRIMIGAADQATPADGVTIIETNIDDMNPQLYEYVFEQLFRAGALDVWLTQIMMKKMRPAVKLSVLCSQEDVTRMTGIILRETTSIGVRYYAASRITMKREFGEVRTEHGSVRIKTSRCGAIRKSSPEYEDCRKIAEKSGIPLRNVMERSQRDAALKLIKKRK
ncbi:MAG: nickel pincer cofactor biosynthesis protein LarC [Thermodesulfovibrionales bacterium]